MTSLRCTLVAYKQGYTDISELCKERIRKVINKLASKKRTNLNSDNKNIGFKVFTLRNSNFKNWENYEGDDIQVFQASLFNFENSLVEGWEAADFITEIQLLEGFPLDSNIEKASEFITNNVHKVNAEYNVHQLFICFTLSSISLTVLLKRQN